MLSVVLISVVTVLAGLAQGVSGFGAGILMMLILPAFYPISQAAAISGLVSLVLTALMALRYRREMNVRKMLFPLLVYATASALAIQFAPRVDQALLKRVFGGFLLVLTAYHFALSKKQPRHWSLPVSIAAWLFSGTCSGLFSVGGPLMVLYFLANTDSKEEYLGTTELLFSLNLFFSSCLRVKNGILTLSLAPVILLCCVAVCVGLCLANRVVERIDGEKLKNLVYAGVGISGLLNLFG